MSQKLLIKLSFNLKWSYMRSRYNHDNIKNPAFHQTVRGLVITPLFFCRHIYSVDTTNKCSLFKLSIVILDLIPLLNVQIKTDT